MVSGEDLRVRRVVTGVDGRGLAKFVTDGGPPSEIVLADGTGVVDLWQTATPVRSPFDGGDPTGEPAAFPPRGGMAWKIGILPPRGSTTGTANSAPHSPLTSSPEMVERSDDDEERPIVENDAQRPGRHRTDTLDFILVVAGEVYLILEEEPSIREVHLKAGDCVVQRGVWHRWENRGDTPCTLSTVMMVASHA